MFDYFSNLCCNNLDRVKVSSRLEEFRDLVKEVVRSACRTALFEAGFTPDDYFYDSGEGIGGNDFVNINWLLYLFVHFVLNDENPFPGSIIDIRGHCFKPVATSHFMVCNFKVTICR